MTDILASDKFPPEIFSFFPRSLQVVHEETGRCLSVDGQALSLTMSECEVCWTLARIRKFIIHFTIREENRNSFGNSKNKAVRTSILVQKRSR